MLELVRRMLPDLGEPLMLTLNRDVVCGRHKDGANTSDYSYILFFNDFDSNYTGGELVTEEPGGDRVLSEKNVWHRFCGRDHVHYNLPQTGTKYSIVAYSQSNAAAAKKGSTRRAAASAAQEHV